MTLPITLCRIYKLALEQSVLLSKVVGWCSSFYWPHSEQRGSVVGDVGQLYACLTFRNLEAFRFEIVIIFLLILVKVSYQVLYEVLYVGAIVAPNRHGPTSIDALAKIAAVSTSPPRIKFEATDHLPCMKQNGIAMRCPRGVGKHQAF